jgi:hypothetical protein
MTIKTTRELELHGDSFKRDFFDNDELCIERHTTHTCVFRIRLLTCRVTCCHSSRTSCISFFRAELSVVQVNSPLFTRRSTVKYLW